MKPYAKLSNANILTSLNIIWGDRTTRKKKFKKFFRKQLDGARKGSGRIFKWEDFRRGGTAQR